MRKFDRQKDNAIRNINYFNSVMYMMILKNILLIILALPISVIIDGTFWYFLTLVFFIYSVYNMYLIYKKYTDIIMDIRNTFMIYDNVSIEIDLKKLFNSRCLFRSSVTYEK